MGGHDHDHHDPHGHEDPTVVFKAGIFFICVLTVLYFLAV